MICSNCQKDIQDSAYLMHSLRCRHVMQRVLAIPEPQVQEPRLSGVSISDPISVMEHKLVHEPMCVPEPSTLETLLIDCEYCELQYSFPEFAEHQSHCGARTDKCDNCSKYIMKMEMNEHLKSCSVSISKTKEMDYDDLVIASILYEDCDATL